MIFIFLAAWVYWIGVAAPSVHWLDSAELTLSSYTLGIGHPPGEVPYLFGQALFQLLPIGDPSWRATLAAAFFSASACVVSLLLVGRGKGNWPTTLTLLALFFSFPVSWQAIRPEVYATTTFLTISSIALAERKDPRSTYSALFLFGLAALTHPLIAATAIPFFFRRSFPFRGLIFLIIVSILILYLPIRAAQKPAWNFGNPREFAQLVWFLEGKLYKAYDVPAAVPWLANSLALSRLMIDALSPALTMMGLFGMVILYRSSKADLVRILLGIGISFFLLISMNNFWPNNPDVGGYITPAILLYGLLILHFVEWASTHLGNHVIRSFFLASIVGILFWQAFHFSSEYSLRSDWSAHDHLRALGEEPPPGSTVSLASFSTLTMIRYGQIVEGRRPDLEVTFRGMRDAGNKLEFPFRSDTLIWEPALFKMSNDRFSLRKEDIARMEELHPRGWFFLTRGVEVMDETDRLRLRTEEVLRTASNHAAFAREPLMLNLLLHALVAQRQHRVTQAKEILEIVREKFPEFNDYSSLEGPP